MSDDESSFRRRRRREGDAADGTTPEQSSPSDEPIADLTPWWRTSGPTPAAQPPAADEVATGTSDGAENTASEERDGVDASADEEEPAPRRRSSFQPINPEPASAPDAAPLPEPAFTPEPASFPEAAFTPDAEPEAKPAPEPEPEPAPLPEPESAPAPVSAREALPEAQPLPPLFKPRPDVDRPWVTRPRDAAVDAGMHSEDYESARRNNTAGNDTPENDTPENDTPENDTAENDTAENDSAPFVWSLTPNDELDPIVHATSSEASESAPPVSSVIPASIPDGVSTAPEPPNPELASPELARPEPMTPEPPSPELANPEPADSEPADSEPTDSEPADSEPTDPETARLETIGTGPAQTRPLDDDDAASLAFLMELEAAAAATSGDDDDHDDDDTNKGDTKEDDTHTDDPTRATGPRPVAAASLSTAEFAGSSELFPVAGDPGNTVSGNTGSGNTASDAKSPRAKRASGSGSERPPLPPVVKWVALGVAALLVLVALFFLGTRLPGLFGASAPAPTPSVTATATPTPTETPTPTTPPAEVVAAVGPVAPGEHKWDTLLGGECLEPYSTPWAETFTVVDCATPHTAQMVFTAPVTSDPAAQYPGEAEIAKQLALWCSAPGVLDLAAAGAYSDLQVQGTYPVSAEQWADGERNYSCFLSRSTGEALTGTLAVAQPAT